MVMVSQLLVLELILDISTLALHELRKRLNMVAQDGSLGSGTLRDALDITRQKGEPIAMA
jgi:ABC-type multidrug transport system fused ATPase/permease subunit